MSDLLEEIKEDIREEQLTKFWKSYGNWVIGGVITILAGTAIGISLQNWKASKLEEYSQKFNAAVSVERTDHEQAEKIFEDLAKTSSGYAVLSKYRLASQAFRKGDLAKASEHLKAVEGMSFSDDIYRDLAKIMRINMNVSADNKDDMIKQLESLTKEKNPLRALALELKGILLMEKGDKELAQATFTKLLSTEVAAPAFLERVKALASQTKQP
ncbi:MAG: tetratricopeptide repeat protein [Alphaproteobacteria bacterium]|nr:tetratricopeptide repeat protein [Alphaproteobacteria bacterium]OJV46635.1 MAG: hypothetical protein BGO28_04715 [Alphaproteobacteria bacterium 43-37]